MALSQALSTGITGLMTHQKAMDNIGNNLANVNTVGFKKGVYQFSTLLEQSMRGGMAADGGRGSVNPISMGMGAQTGSINKVFTQGDIENTGSSNDMAIDGNGFFVLKVGNGYAYTRAGSFYRGEDGSLLAGDGMYVQGTAAVKNADGTYSIPTDAKLQNLVIPIGSTGGHSQTSTVEFTGNLNSNQKLSQGTQLFGGTSYPTVASLQKWMSKDFNGGNKLTDPKVDTSWNSLEKPSYAVSEATLEKVNEVRKAASLPPLAVSDLPANTTTYPNGVVQDLGTTSYQTYPAKYYDAVSGAIVANLDTDNDGYPDLDSAAIVAAGNVPLIEEVKTINGGNVQTSAAYGIQVPSAVDPSVAPTPPGPYPKPVTTVGGVDYYTDTLYFDSNGAPHVINGNKTLPPWFYESTGSPLSYADVIKEMNLLADGTHPTEQAAFQAIWPEGINGDRQVLNHVPVKDEMFSASLNTPLEHIRYQKGNSWVQPYANIKNGDEIDVSFKKGDSQVEITFVYNRPKGQSPFNGQVSIDREQSYTLEHFLKFLGGDVDEPTTACQNISPAMFGAKVTSDYPLGDPDTMLADQKSAYETALLNISLAKTNSNLDETGGAMGLLSIPPHISDKNGGTDAYDVPAESAGAYSREGTGDVNYKRWDAVLGWVTEKGNSFKTSFVSNLGAQNALSDIRISYNNIPHETMYSAETEYAAPQGGASIMTVNFYDSLGNPKTANLRMAMVSQDNDFTTWRWYADCADDTDFQWQADENGELTTNLNVGTGLIRFDKNGNYVKGAEYSESQGITINQANRGVNEPIWIKVLNGLSSSSKQDLDFSDMTCSATESDFKLKHQNGRPPGTLNDFTVSLNGTITGVYSNGNTVVLGRVGLAMFPNENGLIAAGSNLYFSGPASGDARYGHAATGGTGDIKHQQLESSNVDLSIEFTKLISTERGFQANSRTITTADEMIQELLNLKR